MDSLPEWLGPMGLSEPLLSVRMGSCTVTIFRQETMTPLAESVNRDGTVTQLGMLWYLEDCTDQGLTAGPLREYQLNWSERGEERVIVGALPPGAVRVEAKAGRSEQLPVEVGAGAFVLAAPSSRPTWITYKDSKAKPVWRDRVSVGSGIHPNIGDLVYVYSMSAWVLWKKLRGQPTPGS